MSLLIISSGISRFKRNTEDDFDDEALFDHYFYDYDLDFDDEAPLVELPELDDEGNDLDSTSRSCLSQLPPAIGSLTNLKILNLSSNQLSQLPPEIGQLTNLLLLNLSGNQLCQLPPEIGQLINLRTVDLNYNPDLLTHIPQFQRTLFEIFCVLNMLFPTCAKPGRVLKWSRASSFRCL